MKAVVDVVGQYAETFTEKAYPNPNYAYLSWDEITELADSGRIEIGSHTYGMHAEAARLTAVLVVLRRKGAYGILVRIPKYRRVRTACT